MVSTIKCDPLTTVPGVQADEPKSSKNQRSVAWSCGLTLLVTLTVVLGAFGYMEYLRDRQLRTERLARLQQGIAWQVAQMLAHPLQNRNVSLTAGLVDSVMNSDARIQAIQIQGAQVAAPFLIRARDDDWRPVATSTPPQDAQLIETSWDITLHDAVIGRVSVWITDRFDRQALHELIIQRLAGILIVDMVLAAIIGYVFRRIVLLPLRSVEAYAFRVSNGEEDAHLPKGYFPAELENLRASIERLVAELATQYKELFSSNAALAAAKQQYHDVFQNASEGIYQASIEGQFIVVNPAMARMFGYHSPELFMSSVGNALQLYADASDRDRFINHLLAEGLVNDFEARYIDKYGRTIWISETARLAKKPTGTAYFIYGMTQDVTNRRQAEDALRESEEKYRALMESANDAVFVHAILEDGLPGPFLEVNREACQRLGYTREALMRLTPVELDAPRYRGDIHRTMARLLEDGFAVFETAHMARDGRSIPVEVSSRRVELHGKVLVMSIARDITERKRAEAALLESEARLRSQLECILSPETDIDSLELDKIVNIPAIQSLLDRFAELTGASLGLIDLRGKVLIPAGWQEVCLKYHCVLEQTGEMCIETDTRLTRGLKKGEYISTKCGNGMWHVFTPLYIGKRHVANIFMGQFLYDDEDINTIATISQAPESVANVYAYLEALSRVPRFSRLKVELVMQFLVDFAEMVSHLGYGNLKLAKTLWDQKRVEEDLRRNRDALAANQQKLSLAMGMADLMSWEYDYKTDTFDFDQKFFDLFGPCDACDQDGRMTPETYARVYLLPEQAYIVRKGIDRFGLPGMPATSRALEHTIRGRDGSLRNCSMKCTLIRDADGRPSKIIGATQDITERKLADVALRESEARYRGLVEGLPLGVSVLSPEMRILSMNAKMRAWYPKVDVGAHPFCFQGHNDPPRQKTCDNCPIVKTLKDGLHHEMVMVSELAGGVRSFRIISSPIRNARGVITGVIKILDDITEQVLAEDAIRASEQKYRTLLENIPLNIIYKDRDSVYRAVNDHCAHVFDLPLEAFPGLTDFDLFDRSLAERYRADDKRVMETGEQEEFDEPYKYHDKEGIFHVIKTPILNGKGQIESVLVIFWDVTESRHIEIAMREAEKMAAVGTLAGGIAHDFNNILGAIANLALLIKRKLASESEARLDLDQILESANVGKELVRQLLTFRRPEKEIRRRFDPAVVVSNTIKLMKPSFPAHIEIREHLPEGRGMILADPSQFRQVVLNLCSNAIDAMQGHGGLLSISLEFMATMSGVATPQLSLAPGRYAALCVADNGKGIDPSIRGRIFEPFVTSKPKRRGTGLGLAVVHSIAMRHDGAVTVQSRMGDGTSFTIYFPACDMEEKAPNIPTAGPVRGTGRLLLVDDEIILAQSAQRLLEGLGYNVTVCSDGDAAFATFCDNPRGFDLVMTDLTMPGMNGKTLAKKVLELRQDIPIILCTGYSELLSPDEAKSIGLSEYVLKPVDWDSLSTIIANLINIQD